MKETRRGKKDNGKKKGMNGISIKQLSRTKNMEAVLIEMEPGTSFPKMSVHTGEEFKYVLEGTVQFELGGEKRNISEGCWLQHDSHVPHNVSNVSKKKAVYLTIATPPGALSMLD
jgi:quercetin dioxygenase-like cupin family protein